MKHSVLSITSAVLLSLCCVCGEEDPRYLLMYTSGGGVFKFIIGFAIPVHVPMSLIFAHNFQFQYQAIDNATKLDELAQAGILRSLQFRKDQLYSYLQSFLQRNDQEPGCLLKFICQVGETPIDSSGLAGEILQLLFTPDQEVGGEYWYAWQNGTKHQGCTSYSCPQGYGFLDQFSYFA